VVVVWKLDRLSRSLKDLLHIMEKISEAGAGFRSLTEHIDTTTPAGRMMMHAALRPGRGQASGGALPERWAMRVVTAGMGRVRRLYHYQSYSPDHLNLLLIGNSILWPCARR
jgi:hypothetical protein